MKLREHQVDALAAIKAAAADGESRMTLVSACGTGKTLVAVAAARILARRGNVLVVMPTRALVVQTIRRWREAGRNGAALGVCSMAQRDTGMSTDEVVMTQHPQKIAAAAKAGGPFTVFTTYDSLHHIREAHAQFGSPPWDLVVVDEAHRTCTAFGTGWGTVHDDAAIPAKLRLYMTATPRVWGRRRAATDELLTERIPLATMEIREIFGPTVYRLGMAQAIEQGILADYQVVVPVVEDEDADLHAILATSAPGVTAHHDGLRNGAVQVALLRAILEHGLRRVLVFYNRIDDAEAFAGSLPQTALQVGAPLRHEALWSQAIHSKQPNADRHALLIDFGDPDRPCAVLSNVRVLNEGVDMPDVDAVVFVQPRYSIIDAIQAIGRGLRQPPGAGKKTTLVFPVYARRGAKATDLFKNSSFETLFTLLQALRAHDESFMDRIALPITRPRGGRLQVRPSFYAHPERAAQLAQVLGLEIAVPAIGTWEQALASASAYHQRFGHLDVPAPYIDDDGFSLGLCLSNLRLRHALNRLPPEQYQALDALGMRWAARRSAPESMLERARAWAEDNGHLLVPGSEEVGGHKLGAWLAAQRQKATAGRLPAERQQALEAIDPHWNPPWPREWHRKYLRAKLLSPGPEPWHRTSNVPYQRGDGTIDEWVSRQQRDFFRLHHREQRDLLRAIGIHPRPDGREYGGTKHALAVATRTDDPEPAYSKPSLAVVPQARKVDSRSSELSDLESKFDLALQDAAVFLKREGHLDVPQRHYECRRSAIADRVNPLGWWIGLFRSTPHILNAEQRRLWEKMQKKLKEGKPKGPAPAA
ncbi:Helicase associated domain protein [Actinacidiphila glaucinigra]|uniref:DEAD/DEAH box helicase n=1 Tax=Actinacidiphila glaucinigra TaxID=235986 RepID=UPI00371FFF65